MNNKNSKYYQIVTLPTVYVYLGRFRWLPRESRGTAENSVVSPGKLPGDTMVVLVGQMGILSAHAWCGTSVKNTMEETIMKRMIYVNHAIL